MKKIFILISLCISFNLYAFELGDKISNYSYQDSNEVEVALLAGIARVIGKVAAKAAKKKLIPDNTLKPTKNIEETLKPTKNIEEIFRKPNKTTSNWGHLPNPAHIAKLIRKIKQNYPKGFEEINDWDCPNEILEGEFLKELSTEDRCVAYHMRCNVLVTSGKYAGSGFFINSSTVITNYHVVANNNKEVNVYPFINGLKTSVDIIAIDKINDFAALKIFSNDRDNLLQKKQYKYCGISDFSPLKGSKVIAIGNPKDKKYFYVSRGLIKNYNDKYHNIIDKENSDLLHWIEMNAFIDYGSSGGPLFHKGKIIGVNTKGVPNTSENYAIHFIKLNKFIQYNEINEIIPHIYDLNKNNKLNKFKKVIN